MAIKILKSLKNSLVDLAGDIGKYHVLYQDLFFDNVIIIPTGYLKNISVVVCHCVRSAAKVTSLRSIYVAWKNVTISALFR